MLFFVLLIIAGMSLYIWQTCRRLDRKLLCESRTDERQRSSRAECFPKRSGYNSADRRIRLHQTAPGVQPSTLHGLGLRGLLCFLVTYVLHKILMRGVHTPFGAKAPSARSIT